MNKVNLIFINVLHEVAADGASELLAARINEMSDEDYAQYLRYHFYICEKPELLGMTNHLLFVGVISDGKIIHIIFKLGEENKVIGDKREEDLAAIFTDTLGFANAFLAGFPKGLGTTREEVIEGLGNGLMVIEENARLIVAPSAATSCSTFMHPSARSFLAVSTV